MSYQDFLDSLSLAPTSPAAPVEVVCSDGSHVPIFRAFVSKMGKALRSPEELLAIPDTYFCSQCLANYSSSQVTSDFNRCPNCVDCPLCGAAMSAFEDQTKTYFQCSFCMYSSKSIGLVADSLKELHEIITSREKNLDSTVTVRSLSALASERIVVTKKLAKSVRDRAAPPDGMRMPLQSEIESVTFCRPEVGAAKAGAAGSSAGTTRTSRSSTRGSRLRKQQAIEVPEWGTLSQDDCPEAQPVTLQRVDHIASLEQRLLADPAEVLDDPAPLEAERLWPKRRALSSKLAYYDLKTRVKECLLKPVLSVRTKDLDKKSIASELLPRFSLVGPPPPLRVDQQSNILLHVRNEFEKSDMTLSFKRSELCANISADVQIEQDEVKVEKFDPHADLLGWEADSDVLSSRKDNDRLVAERSMNRVSLYVRVTPRAAVPVQVFLDVTYKFDNTSKTGEGNWPFGEFSFTLVLNLGKAGSSRRAPPAAPTGTPTVKAKVSEATDFNPLA